MALRGRRMVTAACALLVHSLAIAAAADPPVITEEPRDQKVPYSEAAAFFCRARGDPAPVITWWRNGEPLQPSLLVEFPQGKGFWVEPVRRTTDEGDYECVAENGVGDPVRAKASLTVIGGADSVRPSGFPRITQDPMPQPVEKGRDFVVRCRATGDPEPTIHWFKDGVPVNMSDSRYRLRGEPNRGDLRIADSVVSDQGKYRCAAENSEGTVYSKDSTVYIRVRRVKPSFTIPPEPMYEVLPGESLNLTCVAVGSPMPHIRWRKEPGSEPSPKENAPIGRAFLVLNNIRESMNYTCLATSELGTVTSHTQVKVQAMPRPPTNLRVSDVTSESVRLTWSYDLDQETIQYYVIQYNQKHGIQQEEISGVITLFYVVPNLAPYTEYEFRVIAVNNIGRGQPSVPVQVTTGPTEPGSAPKNVHVRPLSSSTLVVKWDGPDQPNGQITNYRVYYTRTPDKPLKQWESDVVNAGSTTLTTISNLIPHEIYTFRVQAETLAGSGPISVPVRAKTQQGVPSQPNGLRVVKADATTAELEWDRPSHSGESIINYVVYYNDSYDADERRINIPVREQYTMEGLYPNTQYFVWVAAQSGMGEGAATPAVSFRTDEYVPGEAPREVAVRAIDSRSLLVTWRPPPADQQNGAITYYKLFYKLSGHNDSQTVQIIVNDPTRRNFTLDELHKYAEYSVRVLAGTRVGDGPASRPVLARTDEDVPGKPRNLTAVVLNSTAVQLSWAPPSDNERNGIIRGYQVHVQELGSESGGSTRPRRYEIRNGSADGYIASDLQPSTAYLFRVSALTRKGDGSRSDAARVTTQGGVPNRPKVIIKVIKEEERVTLDVEWSRPTETHGPLLGYRLRYGRVGGPGPLKEVNIADNTTQYRRLSDLERGVQYEFRVSGTNDVGHGQEEIVMYVTSEGAPSGPPSNVSFRFQTTDRVAFTWDPPRSDQRNGKITGYSVRFHKKGNMDHVQRLHPNETKVVFARLEENTEYEFRVLANTSVGSGPWSSPVVVRTDADLVRPPINLRAMATSYSSVEVWWEQVHTATQIVGYQVFYAMVPDVDLDSWSFKTVPITTSAELENLDKNAQYAVMVAARSKAGLGRLSDLIRVRVKPIDVPMNLRAKNVHTHGMSLSWGPPVQLNPRSYRVRYDAVKEFLDAEGVTQSQRIQARTMVVDAGRCDYTSSSTNACGLVIDSLEPFTTYTVNVTAVPNDSEYRAPAKIRVTTHMAAPQPMVKPDPLGVRNGREVLVILPRASEEYGPISHYYIVVVPEDTVNPYRHPESYSTKNMVQTKRTKLTRNYRPYIAAKFYQRDIPYTFALGDGKEYDGFLNKVLEKDKKYRIFVRAVVDTPERELFTSSPYSSPLSLDMKRLPPGALPQRPIPGSPGDPVEVATEGDRGPTSLVWVVGPVVAGVVLFVIFILFLVITAKKRRDFQKSPEPPTVMKPLMCDMSAAPATQPPQTDPVEIRRQNFQTPGMISHPPVHIAQLAEHVDALKANDNQKFSQEYESIETGQQFTWVNSNMDVNRPKNRYANVIAYDHSRVVLQPIEGQAGSDYINANFCDGYRKHNAYIATQGPLPETFADFWRMVWEQRSYTIVMMTRLEERARIKCDQYWPSKGTQTYGPIIVTHTETQEVASYVVRTFQLQRSDSVERREVRQFQFTAWPDHGVPDHPTPFLMFLRRVKALNPSDAGPMVTHCSAGVGRTGCFIAIDSMLERIRCEATVDVYGHVTCLRAQRNYMVQTEDQYIFIHDALLESVVAGNTEVPAKNLQSYISQLLQPTGPGDNITGMELEFKKLANIKAQPFRFVSANLPANKFKNRFVNILPFESTRVCLQPLRGQECSDYINANFIDGYRTRNAYIATQGPLAETTDDFWRMLWEHNSTIIVMLTKLKEMGRDKCHQYWPSDKSARYQYCVVEPISDFNMSNCTMREFNVTDARDGTPRTVRQFQYTDWPEQGVPASGESFVDFVGHVHKTKSQFGLDGPITVHCSAGVGRTGAFIALSIALERMQFEGVVDMFNTVRILRTQRPAMVQTEEEYQICYEAAIRFLQSFDFIIEE
ncbi:tyrosine-protein phosphatase Lar-like isoform X3 [Amphibalanus amphitrite]|uniref:tyrosine-protein phosphatase Lar-like isoform X3 n=1 Tax=Amphibalanus amphitrite TaxID=1232801 RepID=UPI001C91421D|nr:tyrosine-protein phosphatase Lar-like isoform X3 [Amphibalanus amphitrite]